MAMQAAPLPSCIFNPDRTMTLHGHWALQQAVLAYCTSKGYLLRQLKSGMAPNATSEVLNHWRQEFAQALADFAQPRVFAHGWSLEGDFGNEKIRLYLSEGEARACQTRVRAPFRDFLSRRIRNDDWPIDSAVLWRKAPTKPITLAELVGTDAGIDELIYRLDKPSVAWQLFFLRPDKGYPSASLCSWSGSGSPTSILES